VRNSPFKLNGLLLFVFFWVCSWLMEGFMALTLHDKLALVTLGEEVFWDEVLKGSPLAKHVVKTISPRAIVVEPAAVDALVVWLKKRGYLPKVVAQ
jgi:hypothetical protein